MDILYCYAYNNRTCFGENTVESNWTISKLSPTLSSLQTFSSLKEVMIACIRRSLAFPLYRNWKLSLKIIEDVRTILKLGKRFILKCLLDVKYVMEHSEYKFHLVRLYLNDYCVWIQSANWKILVSLRKELGKLKFEKEEMDWFLSDLEKEAKEYKKDYQNQPEEIEEAMCIEEE